MVPAIVVCALTLILESKRNEIARMLNTVCFSDFIRFRLIGEMLLTLFGFYMDWNEYGIVNSFIVYVSINLGFTLCFFRILL